MNNGLQLTTILAVVSGLSCLIMGLRSTILYRYSKLMTALLFGAFFGALAGLCAAYVVAQLIPANPSLVRFCTDAYVVLLVLAQTIAAIILTYVLLLPKSSTAFIFVGEAGLSALFINQVLGHGQASLVVTTSTGRGMSSLAFMCSFIMAALTMAGGIVIARQIKTLKGQFLPIIRLFLIVLSMLSVAVLIVHDSVHPVSYLNDIWFVSILSLSSFLLAVASLLTRIRSSKAIVTF